MRILRGPYFAIVCIVGVAAGVALGWVWFPRAAAPTRPDAGHYHQQADILRELEPVFQRIDEALVKALAPHNPVCDGPGGVCTAKSDPGLGSGRPAFGNIVSVRRAGKFRNIILSVSRQAGTPIGFKLSMDFASTDGRLAMTGQEKESLLRVSRDYGFGDPDQARMLAACAETSPADRAKAVTAAGVTFTCRLLGTGRIGLEFSGAVPGALAAPG